MKGEDSNQSVSVETLFSKEYLPMVKLASWLVNDQDLAEEIVQDVFVRLSAPTLDLSSVDSPKAYLRTAVVNQSRSKVRKLVVEKNFIPERVQHVESHENFLADESLAAAIAELPQRQRECIVLRFTDDLRVTEIAGVLQITHGTVSKHIRLALKNLEVALGDTDQMPIDTTEGVSYD